LQRKVIRRFGGCRIDGGKANKQDEGGDAFHWLPLFLYIVS
jgi:hypothetical protein